MNYLVSFVIPAYNVGKYIENCIHSIIHQTIPSWELILVDDGSTDTTPDICDKYANLDARIHVIHQENQGSAVARNSGFDVACGQWVAFIDGDDWIEENYIEILQSYMKDEYDFIMYSYDEVHGTTVKNKYCSEENIILDKNDFHLLVMDVIDTEQRMKKVAASRSQFWTKLYNRQFLLKNGIRSDAKLRMSQDVMFNLCVYNHAKKAIFLPKKLYHYRILGNSTCHRYSEDQVARIKCIMEAIGSYIDKTDLGQAGTLLYQKRILVSLVNSCILDFCHKNNPNRYRERKKQFLKLKSEEPFCSAFTTTVIREFSFQKQVCMWLVKWNWFGLLTIILRMK